MAKQSKMWGVSKTRARDERYSGKHRWYMAVLLCSVLAIVPLTALAYVLQGPHVLALMAETMSGAKILRVEQEVVVENPDIPGQTLELAETLLYWFPDRFRAESLNDGRRRVHVMSAGQTITIVDGVRDDVSENRFDLYKDLLLYRNPTLLHKMLLARGVDVEKTSLGRFEDSTVYVVGAQYPDTSVSQLWVDKERFVPLRWINVSDETQPDQMTFVYKQWRKWNDIWYPRQIDLYHNERLVRQINVKKVTTNVKTDAALFDVTRLRTEYPPKQTVPVDRNQNNPTQLDDVQRTIEEFQKKFEQ